MLKSWSGAAPSLLLDDLRGDRHDPQSFAGKIVVAHFFATWCEPCVSEMASLQRLAIATYGKPLVILAVEVDPRVPAFFQKQPVDFTVLLDRDRAVTES